MTDWSEDEYSGYLDDIPKQGYESGSVLPVINVTDLSPVDWRTEGYVNPIRDQGVACGASWAFSAVAALESTYMIKYGGPLIDFSVQQLIDCSLKDRGCNSGLVYNAFDYLFKHSAVTEDSYPYTGP